MRKSIPTFILFATSLSLWAQESPKLGKAPTETSVEVIINAPIEKVWKEFAGIGAIFLKNQPVDTSYTSSEIKTGVMPQDM